MRPISREVKGEAEIFETHYGDITIEFAVPLGSFEPGDIVLLNTDEAEVTKNYPDFQQVLQNLADFAWNMRHPMRVEFFVSPHLIPALIDNNFDGLDEGLKHKVKAWSALAREHNHDMFFTDGVTEQDAICEILSIPANCRRILAHYNLALKLDLSAWAEAE
ncbi:MAG TPA: hypothetical protein VK062_04995 [Burkholderiaceae bacterium]|nr:hypothetical protein [Burkholderiaceae bacterium]